MKPVDAFVPAKNLRIFVRKRSRFKHFRPVLKKVIYNNQSREEICHHHCNSFIQIIVIINLFHFGFGFEVVHKIMEI